MNVRLVPLLAVALLPLGVANSPVTLPLDGQRSAQIEGWRDDLRFYAAELPARHANVAHFISLQTFKTETETLDRQLGDLDSDQFWVGLQRIESTIGDGHTFMRLPKESPGFGLEFKRFGQDYRLVGIQSGLTSARALGARLVAVNGIPVKQVHRTLLALTPEDERLPLRELRAEPMLSNGLVLHGTRNIER